MIRMPPTDSSGYRCTSSCQVERYRSVSRRSRLIVSGCCAGSVSSTILRRTRTFLGVTRRRHHAPDMILGPAKAPAAAVALIMLPGRQGGNAIPSGVDRLRSGVAGERVIQPDPPRSIAEMLQRQRGEQHRATGPNPAFHDVAGNTVAHDVFDADIKPRRLGPAPKVRVWGRALAAASMKNASEMSGYCRFPFGGFEDQHDGLQHLAAVATVASELRV